MGRDWRRSAAISEHRSFITKHLEDRILCSASNISESRGSEIRESGGAELAKKKNLRNLSDGKLGGFTLKSMPTPPSGHLVN